MMNVFVPLFVTVSLTTVPLMMAYITRYIFGTDKLRPQAFEVRGINGISTGVVHCQDAAMLSQWIKHITNNIIGLTNLQVSYVVLLFLKDKNESNG